MTSADFAQAQQRLAARRAQREAQIRARNASLAASHSQPTDTTSHLLRWAPARLRPTLNTLFAAGGAQWDTIKGREGTKPAFRVGQVDAELLDEELLDLLNGQVGEGLKYFGPHLRDEWSAEIMLALRAVLFKLSIWDHDASYGAALQNLRYTDARSKSLARVKPSRLQKVLYGLFSVGGRYGWEKWQDYLLDAEGGYEEPSALVQRLGQWSSTLSAVHSVGAFVSFLVFLVNGKYRTLLDRVLRLRLTPTTSQVGHEVSFEYLNRQLVWHAFTEFLLFILPLVGISRWRRWLSRAWRRVTSIYKKNAGEDDEGVKVGGEYGFLPERTCAICYQDQNPTAASEEQIAALSVASTGVVGSAQTDITNVYEAMPCGCKYCFVCLAQRLEAEEGEGWVCLRCGEIVGECQPWNGDVVVEDVRKSNGSQKTVGFAEDGGAIVSAEKGHDEGQTQDSGFQTLEPVPERDEFAAVVEAELEHSEFDASRSLIESNEWSQVDDEDEDDEVDEDPTIDEDEGASYEDEYSEADRSYEDDDDADA